MDYRSWQEGIWMDQEVDSKEWRGGEYIGHMVHKPKHKKVKRKRVKKVKKGKCKTPDSNIR